MLNAHADEVISSKEADDEVLIILIDTKLFVYVLLVFAAIYKLPCKSIWLPPHTHLPFNIGYH